MASPPALPRLDIPRLLVSVRSLRECHEALAGGAEVIDLKDPRRGPLGMADLADIHSVSADLPGDVPLSVALGEMVEWIDTPGVPGLPQAISFAKLGLSGMARAGDWVEAWIDVRHRFDAGRERTLDWVAVAYADWTDCGAPAPDEVIEMAIATGCRAVLIDTFDKRAATLVDLIDAKALAAIIAPARSAGLLVALAGGLSRGRLPELAGVLADIIAIRGAACAGGGRTGRVEAAAVGRFHRAIAATWAAEQVPGTAVG